MRALGLGLALTLALGACSTKQRDGDAGAAQTSEAETSARPIPDSAEAFLAELLPLPDGAGEAIELRYTITGPALSGELVTVIAAGGRRRDRWELRSSAGDAGLRADGITIINAQDIWTGHDGGAGERRANHLGELARAYLALEPDARAAVVDSIRAWHQTLAEQRERHAGERAQILGVSCLLTRVAAQNVCMWEEAGLLLHYEGAAFTVDATKIDRSIELGPDSFDLPAPAASLEPVASQPHDYSAVLAELAAGSYATVSLLVLGAKGVPELRLPEPAEPAEPPAGLR